MGNSTRNERRTTSTDSKSESEDSFRDFDEGGATSLHPKGKTRLFFRRLQLHLTALTSFGSGDETQSESNDDVFGQNETVSMNLESNQTRTEVTWKWDEGSPLMSEWAFFMTGILNHWCPSLYCP